MGGKSKCGGWNTPYRPSPALKNGYTDQQSPRWQAGGAQPSASTLEKLGLLGLIFQGSRSNVGGKVALTQALT